MLLSLGKPGLKDYNVLLDQLSGLRYNSVRTSTIPLAQFWHEHKKKIKFLEEKIGITLHNPHLCFEYPTSQRGKGRSSMSDIMILSENNKQIAVEAKYTEYAKKYPQETETVEEWKKKKNFDNRQNVADGWWKMIEPFRIDHMERSDSICYQFLHRTASACFSEPEQAIVIYQMFYTNDQNHLDKRNEFEKELQKWVGMVKPKKQLKFYIWKIEATLKSEEYINVFNPKNKNALNPFQELKHRPLYDFSSETFEPIQNG
jgi:hypothetical protein